MLQEGGPWRSQDNPGPGGLWVGGVPTRSVPGTPFSSHVRTCPPCLRTFINAHAEMQRVFRKSMILQRVTQILKQIWYFKTSEVSVVGWGNDCLQFPVWPQFRDLLPLWPVAYTCDGRKCWISVGTGKNKDVIFPHPSIETLGLYPHTVGVPSPQIRAPGPRMVERSVS